MWEVLFIYSNYEDTENFFLERIFVVVEVLYIYWAPNIHSTH